MSCYISAGNTLDSCSVGVGGILEVWIAADGLLTGYTYDADDQVTGITSSSGTTLYHFELKRGLSSLTQTINKSFENGTLFFTQELTIVMHKMSAAKRNQMYLLALNDKLQIIAKDNNGIQYLLGKVYGLNASGTAETGAALADANSITLTFTAEEAEPADLISGAIADVFDGSIS